jgi:3-oxoacyl-[acyl-carrier-protein] synthase III
MEKLPVSLLGLKHAFGERVVENAEIEAKYGVPEGWIKEKTYKEKGHAWENGEDAPIEASLNCLNLLLEETGVSKDKIKAVFGTTNPITIDGEAREESLTETFARRAQLLPDIKICDEGWGCGGSAIGVESMNNWLSEQPVGTYAIYVTQDWSTKMVRTRNVEALFSDAVSVSLWGNNEEGVMEIENTFASNSTIDEGHLNIVGGFWEMDGKGVSQTAADVPALVAEKLGIDLKNYDIVPHQPNAKLLETMEKQYGVHLHKQVAIEHGNPTCSGAFIALEKVLEARKGGTSPNAEKDILVMPFGAGGIGGFILKEKKSG